MHPKSFPKASPEAVRTFRGPLRVQNVFRHLLRSYFYRFRPPLGIPWALLGVPLGNLFETCLLPGGPTTRKWMPFWLICFRMLFLHVFLWVSGRPGRQKHGFRVGRVAEITLSPEFEIFNRFGCHFGFVLEPKTHTKSCSGLL